GADTITLGSSLVNGSIDLGSGNDKLTLADGVSNKVSVANVETILGGTGNDTITATGTVASKIVAGGGLNYVSGNSAADVFVLDQSSAGNVTTIMNFNAAAGQKIMLDTNNSATFGNDTYTLASALTNNTNIKAVADASTLLATNLGVAGFA